MYKPRTEYGLKNLAKMFNVSKATIECVVYNKTWKEGVRDG